MRCGKEKFKRLYQHHNSRDMLFLNTF